MAEITVEDCVYLPEDVVKTSPGFTVDVGSSLIKVLYRSNRDFQRGHPVNNEAIKDGLARLYRFKVSRDFGCKALAEILRERCDVTRPSDPSVKIKVIVTGVGSNIYREDLETNLNVQLVTAMEDSCSSQAFKIMADITPAEDLFYPTPPEGLQGAKEYAEMHGGYFLASGTTSVENYSRFTHCQRPIPDGTRPYLPCLLSSVGSGNIIMKLDTNGNKTIIELHGVAGINFLGFARYNHGPISFQDLMSRLEATDGASVDAMMSDIVASDSDSDYAKMKSNRRALPYAKLPSMKDLENVKKEDVTFSLLRSMAEFQGQMLHAHALAHEVRKIYLVGSFIDIPLVRRFVTEEIQGRNLLRPKSQHIDFNFVRGGGYITAFGAFIEGAKRQQKNSTK